MELLLGQQQELDMKTVMATIAELSLAFIRCCIAPKIGKVLFENPWISRSLLLSCICRL